MDTAEHLSDPELDKEYQATKQQLDETRAKEAEKRNQNLDMDTGVKKFPMTRAIASGGGLTENEMNDIENSQKTGQGLTEEQMNAIETADIAKAPTPIDTSKISAVLKKNLDDHFKDIAPKPPSETATEVKPPFEPPVAPQVEEAKGFIDAIEKTFGASNIGMMAHGGLPTKVLPEQGDMLYRIVGQLGMAPDLIGVMLPAGIVGGVAGAGLGTLELPGAGTITGAAAGGVMNAWGTEAGLRQALVDAYSTGSAENWKDVWPHVAANFINGYTKGAVTGVATELAGGPTVLAALLSKAVTMTAVGSAMEGKMPTKEAFADSAAIFLGTHFMGSILPNASHETSRVSGKLQDIWAKTGKHPAEILETAKTDPALQQQILSTNIDIPKSLEGAVDLKAVSAEASPKVESTSYAPKNVSPVLGEGFSPENKLEIEKAPASLEKVSAGEGGVIEEVHPMDKQIVSSSGRPPELKTNRDIELYLDSLHPLKEMTRLMVGGKDAHNAMDVIDDPYALAELVRSAETKATAFLQEGPREFLTHKLTGTPSLMKTVKSIPKSEFEAFRRFRVAATNLERHDAGIPTGLEIEGENGIRKVFEEGKKKYEKPLLDIVKFHNDKLAYLRDAGIVSEASYKKSVDKWKYYSPMMQAFEDGQSGTPNVGGRGLQVKQVVHELKGKEAGAKIVDPFESDVNTIFAAVKVAERNRALQALKKLQDENSALNGESAEKLVQEVPTEGPKTITSQELHDPKHVSSDLDGKVSYFENGERKTLLVPKQVAEAIKGAPYQQMGTIGKLAMIPVNVERFGAIHNFPFPIRHMIRSEFVGWMNSQNWYLPPGYRLIHGLYHELMNTPEFSDARFSGALQASLEKMDRDYISKNIYDLSHKTGLVDSIQNMVKSPAETSRIAFAAAMDAAKHPLDTAGRAYNHLIDSAKGVVETAVNAPKVSEAITVRRQAKTDDLRAKLNAAYEGRNVNADGTRMGSSTTLRTFSQYTPFWNLKLQSKKQFLDNLRDRPTSTLLKGGSMALVAAGLWYLNKDDEDVKQSSDYIKDFSMQFVEHNWQPATTEEASNYPEWRVRQGSNGNPEIDHKVIHRFPVPWDQGLIFMSATARALQSCYDEDKKSFGKPGSNEHAWDGFAQNLTKQLLTDMIPLPAPLLPPIEHLTNQSTLTGSPIVPVQLQGINHDMQATDYTSMTMMEIGHALGSTSPYNEIKKHGPLSLASPIALQHLWDGWTGGLGKTLLGVMDHELAKYGVYPPEQRPQDDLKDLIGWTRAFEVKFPAFSANDIHQFYYRMEANQHVAATVEFLKSGMKPIEGMQAFIDQLRDGNVGDLGKSKQVISDMMRLARLVQLDPGANPGEKRMQIDNLTYHAIESAKMGNKIMDEFEHMVKEHKADFDEMEKELRTFKKAQAGPAPQNAVSPQPDLQPAPQPQQQPPAPQAPTPNPQQIRHVKPAPQKAPPIPGTDSNWQNPALAPTHPSKAGGE